MRKGLSALRRLSRLEWAERDEQSPLADTEAGALLEEILADSERPLVMFALEWCEFCWSARKLFAALGLDYRSVDLDSVAYQQDDLGGRLRVALRQRTGQRTIPQIFLGGEHLGGCSELFAAYADGSLQRRLRDLGIAWREEARVDPAKLAPGWLHPRG